MSRDHVYVIQSDAGPIKIGVTRDLDARLAQLQTGNPHRLTLAYSTRVHGDAYEVEAETHAILDRHRLSGEWFSAPPDVAVAAINGAAFRLGNHAEGDDERKPNWPKRVLLVAGAFTPAFGFLAVGQPLGFILLAFLALIGMVKGLMRTEAAGATRDANIPQWCGTIITGLAVAVFIAALFAVAVNAHADEDKKIPIYNSALYCANLSAFVGNNETIKSNCLDMEKQSHENVSRIWERTPQKIQKDCIQLMSMAGNYQALAGCLSSSVGSLWMKGELTLTPNYP